MLGSIDLNRKLLMLYISEMVALIILFLISLHFFPPSEGMISFFAYCITSIIYFSFKIIKANDVGVAIYCLAILSVASMLFQLSIYTFPIFFCAVLPLTRINSGYIRFSICLVIIFVTVIQALYFNVFNGYIAVFVLGIITTLIVESTYISQLKQKHELVMGAEKVDLLAKIAERERVAEDLSDDLLDFFDTIEELSSDSLHSINNKHRETEESIKNIQQLTRETLSNVRRIVVDYRQGTIQRVIQDSSDLLAKHGIKLDINLNITPINPEIEAYLSEVISALFNIITLIPECTHCKFDIYSSDNNIICSFSTGGKLEQGTPSGLKLGELMKKNTKAIITVNDGDLLNVDVTLPLQ